MTVTNNSQASSPVLSASNVQDQAESLFTASSIWFQTHWLQIIIAVAAAAVIIVALHFLRRLGHKLCNLRPGAAGWGTVFGRAIVKTGNFFIVMVAAKLVAGYANAPREVATTITFLFTVSAVFQAAIWAREIILGAIEHRTGSESYSGEAIGSAMGIIRLLVTFALFAIALIVVLDNLGVNVTGLVAGLGVGGIAIGLAAQGIFGDLFAALAIIFDRPFRRGDAISYDNSSGTVEAIGLKSTRIRAATGEERIIANRNLLDKEILNTSQRDYRRGQFKLGLVQWTPVEKMEKLPGILEEVIEGCGRKFVRAGFIGFGDASYDFDVEFDLAFFQLRGFLQCPPRRRPGHHQAAERGGHRAGLSDPDRLHRGPARRDDRALSRRTGLWRECRARWPTTPAPAPSSSHRPIARRSTRI